MNSEPEDVINWQTVHLHTSKGIVDVIYDLQIEGKTCHLKNVLVYARQEQPIHGVLRELLASRAEIAELARLTGCDKLRITGHRSLESTSANPGKRIDVTVRIAGQTETES